MGIIKIQVVFACRIQVDGSTVEVFAEILYRAFPAAYLLVGPFTEALSDVGSQEIHGFVEVTSIGRGDVIQLDSKIFCHQHDVNKVGQVVL